MSDTHAKRHTQQATALGPRAALLLASPPEQLRNGDVHYKFRQDSDILYLTGFEEPGPVVLLRPDHPKTPIVMFVRPRNPSEETWPGRRAGIEGASDAQRRVYEALLEGQQAAIEVVWIVSTIYVIYTQVVEQLTAKMVGLG